MSGEEHEEPRSVSSYKFFRLFFPDSFSDIIDEYDEVSRYVVYAYSSTSILMNNIIPVPGV